jgi:hypothetical protein
MKAGLEKVRLSPFYRSDSFDEIFPILYEGAEGALGKDAVPEGLSYSPRRSSAGVTEAFIAVSRCAMGGGGCRAQLRATRAI